MAILGKDDALFEQQLLTSILRMGARHEAERRGKPECGAHEHSAIKCRGARLRRWQLQRDWRQRERQEQHHVAVSL